MSFRYTQEVTLAALSLPVPTTSSSEKEQLLKFCITSKAEELAGTVVFLVS